MRVSVWATDSLKYAYRALCLIALLITGQQGAAVHEIGHLAAAQSTVAQVGVDQAADGACALCPLYAQVATAAFSHSFDIPSLFRPGIGRVAVLPIEALGSAVPTPRSRGPPSLS